MLSTTDLPSFISMIITPLIAMFVNQPLAVRVCCP